MNITDRSWATEISDEAFPHEYVRRFPLSDVVPTREDYLASTADQVKAIVFPSTEQYEIDGGGPGEEHLSESDASHREVETVSQGGAFCTECCRAFSNQHALAIHQGRSHKPA